MLFEQTPVWRLTLEAAAEAAVDAAAEGGTGKAIIRAAEANRSLVRAEMLRLGLAEALPRAGVPVLVMVVVTGLVVMEWVVRAAEEAMPAGGVARMTSLLSGWTRSLSFRAVPFQQGLGCSQSLSAC